MSRYKIKSLFTTISKEQPLPNIQFKDTPLQRFLHSLMVATIEGFYCNP